MFLAPDNLVGEMVKRNTIDVQISQMETDSTPIIYHLVLQKLLKHSAAAWSIISETSRVTLDGLAIEVIEWTHF